MATKNNG